MWFFDLFRRKKEIPPVEPPPEPEPPEPEPEPPEPEKKGLDVGMPPYRNPPVAGPIKQIKKFDIMSEYRGKRMSPDELISRHVPVQALSPLDPTSYRILTASQMDKMQLQKMESRKAGAKTNTVYANPMQHLDYQIYETLCKTTITGALMDMLVRYVMGAGFKPALEVIHPSDDKEADKDLIEANQGIIRDLVEIDRQVDGYPPTDARILEAKMEEDKKKSEEKNGKEGKGDNEPKKDEPPKVDEKEKEKAVSRTMRLSGLDDGNGADPEASSPDGDENRKAALEMKTKHSVSFRQKFATTIWSAFALNRGALHFQYNKPIIIRGKEYKDVFPSHMSVATAQDLGVIKVDDETNDLTHVQVRTRMEDWTEVKDMIYLWNPVSSAKAHNSWYYGTSMLAPLISSSKLMRGLLSETFPAITKAAWAGLFVMFAKNEGSTPESKQQEYEALTNGIIPGTPSVVIMDPNDAKVENIDYDAKITELLELLEGAAKMMISCLGLPQVAFFDESAANRSTMVGKIQLVLRTVIEPLRDWIGEELKKQWYEPNYRYLYADQPDLLSQLQIKISWADLHISEWTDTIDGALELDSRNHPNLSLIHI